MLSVDGAVGLGVRTDLVNGDQFRKLALSLPNTSEAPHFDKAAFRTPKRSFATLAADALTVNLKLEPEHQAALVEARPDAFEIIPGGWGRQGWTTLTLAKISVAEAKTVLVDAHATASADIARKAPRAPANKRASAKSPTRKPLNRDWHEANAMPKNATTAQRVAWHRKHQKACGCRPVPKSLIEHFDR